MVFKIMETDQLADGLIIPFARTFLQEKRSQMAVKELES